MFTKAIDPRAQIVILVAVSSTILSPGGAELLPSGIIIGILLSLHDRDWKRLASMPLVLGILGFFAFHATSLWPNPALAIISTILFFVFRMVVTIYVAAHLVSTTTPSRMTAAIRAAKIPRALAVPFAVVMRFLPSVIAEFKAVIDAMRLRSLTGFTGLIRHPLASIGHLTVPLISSSLRVGDDLSASALLRGLGSRTKPTSLNPPRFTSYDWAWLLLTAIIFLTNVWMITR